TSADPYSATPSFFSARSHDGKGRLSLPLLCSLPFRQPDKQSHVNVADLTLGQLAGVAHTAITGTLDDLDRHIEHELPGLDVHDHVAIPNAAQALARHRPVDVAYGLAIVLWQPQAAFMS